MSDRRELGGAVVAVIGATGGLGSAISDRLEDRGARIVAVNRTGSRDGRTIDVTVDIRDATAGEAVVEYATSEYGRLDGVVVVAGIVAFGDVTETDDVTVEELFLTNAMAPLWIARRAADPLAERSGFFLNVSAVVAAQPTAGMAPYSASKAAAAAGLDALRKEWRRSGIDVIDVQPPHTETGLATRPLAGTAPDLPDGLDPATVAARIVEAIESRETLVPADAFA